MLRKALIVNTPFNVYFGLEGWMINSLTAGFSAVDNLFDALSQILFMSFFRFVSLFFLKQFRSITEACHMKRKKEEEESN